MRYFSSLTNPKVPKFFRCLPDLLSDEAKAYRYYEWSETWSVGAAAPPHGL